MQPQRVCVDVEKMVVLMECADAWVTFLSGTNASDYLEYARLCLTGHQSSHPGHCDGRGTASYAQIASYDQSDIVNVNEYDPHGTRYNTLSATRPCAWTMFDPPRERRVNTYLFGLWQRGGPCRELVGSPRYDLVDSPVCTSTDVSMATEWLAALAGSTDTALKCAYGRLLANADKTSNTTDA